MDEFTNHNGFTLTSSMSPQASVHLLSGLFQGCGYCCMMQFSFISHSGLQTGAFDYNKTNDDASETGDHVPELTSTSMGLIFTIAYNIAGVYSAGLHKEGQKKRQPRESRVKESIVRTF